MRETGPWLTADGSETVPRRSELELPYVPKQVLDCIFINTLIADRNLLDEVDPAIGRMGQVRCPVWSDSLMHLLFARALVLQRAMVGIFVDGAGR